MNDSPLFPRLLAALAALSVLARAEEPAKDAPQEKPPAGPAAARAAAIAQAAAQVQVQVQGQVQVLQNEDVNIQIEAAGDAVDAPVILRGGGRIVLGNGGRLVIGGNVIDGQDAAGGLKPTGAAARPAETSDTLEFLNGDRLRGELGSVDPAAGLTWKHELAEQPITFRLPGLQAARLAPPYQTAPTNAEPSLVQLTNDDRLAGRLLRVDAEAVVLDTWYAGTVSIRRAMVRRLVPNLKSQAVVYEGPDDLANWSLGERTVPGAWKLRGNTLLCYQQTPIGREIPGWPDKARIDFEVGWDNYPGFNICFYADSLQIYNNNGYMLQVSGSSLYFRRQQRNRGANNLWNKNLEEFNQSRTRKAAFTLLVDRQKASFSLLMNGDVVHQWTDSNGFAGEGSGIVLQPQAMGGMRFSNIRVAHWNGAMPDKDARPDPAQDHLNFVNRDTVSGELVSIGEGRAKVKSSYGEVEVPLERISEITLAQDKLERARRNKEDVRLVFAGPSTVTFGLKRMAEDRLHGASENFGDITVPLSVARLVEFNIYKKRLADPVEESEE